MPRPTEPQPVFAPLTREEFSKLSEKEKILRMVEQNLELYGDTRPPPEVILQSQVRTCVTCGKTGRVIPTFGTYAHKSGKVYAHSQCTTCRGSRQRIAKVSTVKARAKLFTREMLDILTPAQRKAYDALWEEAKAAVLGD